MEKNEGWSDRENRLLIIFSAEKVNHFFQKNRKIFSPA